MSSQGGRAEGDSLVMAETFELKKDEAALRGPEGRNTVSLMKHHNFQRGNYGLPRYQGGALLKLNIHKNFTKNKFKYSRLRMGFALYLEWFDVGAGFTYDFAKYVGGYAAGFLGGGRLRSVRGPAAIGEESTLGVWG